MRWWEWFMPWKWPWFSKRKEEAETASERFRKALEEAREQRGDLDKAVATLKKQRKQREEELAESMAPPPHRPLAKSSPS